MRLKYVIAVLLSAVLVLGAAWFLKQNGGTAGSPTPDNEMAAPTSLETSAEVAGAPAPVAVPTAGTNVLTPEQREAAIDVETGRLQEWSMSGDPAVLNNILADLTHPEPEVREAAIEAAKQFGDTNAIPALKAAAANAADIEEQIALLEAAQFLSLPPMHSGEPDNRTPEQKQADAQRAAEKRARIQELMNKHASGQASSGAPATAPNRGPSTPGRNPPGGSHP